MYKYQLTFIKSNNTNTAKSSDNKSIVFDTESEAIEDSKGYKLFEKGDDKGTDKLSKNVVEVTRVLYQDGKACTAKLVLRKYVKDKTLIVKKAVAKKPE